MAVPVAPAIRAWQLSADKVRVIWLAVPGATSYNLYRGSLRGDVNVTGRNEKQTVTVTAAGGSFTLTYSTQETAAIAFDATAQAVEDALVALSNIAPGDVAVTKVDNVYTVEFTGLLARTNVAEMTGNATGLSGQGHAVDIATTVAGIGPFDDNVTSPYLDDASVDTQYVYALRAKNAEGEGPLSNQVRLSTYSRTDGSATTPTRAKQIAGRVLA